MSSVTEFAKGAPTLAGTVAAAGRVDFAATWTTAKQASEFLGISRKALARLGDERKLTRRCVPGGNPKYLRADVERLAERSTTSSLDA